MKKLPGVWNLFIRSSITLNYKKMKIHWPMNYLMMYYDIYLCLGSVY